MKLLIDMGNSRLKWATWDGVALQPGGAIDNDQASVEALSAVWNKLPALDSAWVASVAPPALDARVAESLQSARGLSAVFVHSVAAACGVRSAYEHPRRLGVDRFLAMIAVHASGGGPSVVAGCGTALTLDAVDAHGNHLGGLIAPSPALMQAALRGATARLGEPAAVNVVEMAGDTAEAIESGTRLAAVALVERFAAVAGGKMGAAPELVLARRLNQ